MDGWTLGLLEVAPVAIAAVIVFRHFRAARRVAAVEQRRDSAQWVARIAHQTFSPHFRRFAMQGKTLAQIYALVLGAVLVLVGILGFLVEPSFGIGDDAQSAAR